MPKIRKRDSDRAAEELQDFTPRAVHFVRFDTAIYQDYFVPPYYDSMIGKLIVQARSRAEAIRKMKMALSELTIDGIDINRDLLAEILSDEQL